LLGVERRIALDCGIWAEDGLRVKVIRALLKAPCGLRWHAFGGAVRELRWPASVEVVRGLRLPATRKNRSQVTDFKYVLRHAMMLRS